MKAGLPKRFKNIGKTTNIFFQRECPQNIGFIKNPNNLVIGELFFDEKNNEYPFSLIYKESFPIMTDGFMIWFFKDLNQLMRAKWEKLK